MEISGIFYDHKEYFVIVCLSLGQFGVFCGTLLFFHVLVYCIKKNLATLFETMLGW
jgi:hypothetical protein